MRSRSGPCVYEGGALCAWRSHAQSLNTFSTCESESCAVSDSLEFAKAIPCIEIFGNNGCPIYGDNESSTSVANSEIVSCASQHVKLRCLKVSEHAKRLRLIGTRKQCADGLTKTGVEIYRNTVHPMQDMNLNDFATQCGSVYWLPSAYRFLRSDVPVVSE